MNSPQNLFDQARLAEQNGDAPAAIDYLKTLIEELSRFLGTGARMLTGHA